MMKRWTARLSFFLIVGSCTGCKGSGDRQTEDTGGSTDTGDNSDVAATGGMPTACVPSASLIWEPCEPAPSECAMLEVPLDREDPASEIIQLRVMRNVAADPASRRGTLLFHPGGLARASTELASVQAFLGLAPVLYPDLHAHYDLIALDLRGGSAETRIDCSDFEAIRDRDLTPETEDEWAALDEYWRTFTEECTAARDPRSFEALSTSDNAKDIACLLDALGEQRTAYLGLSYGSLVGASFAAQFPERTGNFVLDAAVAPAPDFPTNWARRATATERGFRQLIGLCAQDPNCAFHGSEGDEGIAQAYIALAVRLDAGMVQGVSEGDLHMAAYAAVVQGDASELWPALARLESENDGTDLLALADSAWPGNPGGQYFALAPNDFPCPEDWTLEDAKQAIDAVRAEAPLLGPALMTHALVCLHWPVHTQPLDVAAAAAAPSLVIGGRRDALADVEDARRLAGALGNGSHVFTHDEPGHTAFFASACVRALGEAFLVEGTPPPGDAACPE